MLQFGRQSTIWDPTGLRLTQMTVPGPAAFCQSERQEMHLMMFTKCLHVMLFVSIFAIKIQLN